MLWSGFYVRYYKEDTTRPYLPSPPYLRAAVGGGGAPVGEVVLGQQEGGVGHVQQWVVDQYHFAEVELVGEALALGLVQDALVVIVPVR